MRRVLAVGVAAFASILMALPAIAGAQSTVHHASGPTVQTAKPRITSTGYNYLPNYKWGLYMRDPNGGGQGTVVEGSSFTASNAEEWNVIYDTGRCSGTGAPITLSCAPGLSRFFHGYPLVVIKNRASGLCLGVSSGTSYEGTMRPCDTGPSGNNETSTAFAWAATNAFTGCSLATCFAFPSFTWAQGHGSEGAVDSNGVLNSAVFADATPGGSNVDASQVWDAQTP